MDKKIREALQLVRQGNSAALFEHCKEFTQSDRDELFARAVGEATALELQTAAQVKPGEFKTARDRLIDAILKIGTFHYSAEPEWVPVRGNAIATGSQADDKRYEDQIIQELEAGNVWAWCQVTVSLYFDEIELQTTLGACSYESAQDFVRCGEYDTLKRDLAGELADSINKIIAHTEF